jgi:spermidine/putrescine transport system permease protein
MSASVEVWAEKLRAVPVLLWAFAFSIGPILILAVYSLWSSNAGIVDTTPSLDNYVRIFSSEAIRTLLGRTLFIAAGVAFLSTVIGFFAAFFVVRYMRSIRIPVTLLFVVPLWISFLMRIFAWKIILGDKGVLNSFLVATGVIDSPSSAFLYSPLAVAIALVYVGIPFAYLSSYAILDRIPERLFEASADLGAGGLRTFREVVLPISLPSIGLGFILVFIIAYGDYVTPTLVGGFSGTMVGSVVLQAFGGLNNWPLGAALSVITLVVGLLVVALVNLVTRNRTILED